MESTRRSEYGRQKLDAYAAMEAEPPERPEADIGQIVERFNPSVGVLGGDTRQDT